MKISAVIRANNEAMRANMAPTLTKMRETMAKLSSPELPETMHSLVNELGQKMAVFMAMGQMQAYLDMMEAYAAIMEEIEREMEAGNGETS